MSILKILLKVYVPLKDSTESMSILKIPMKVYVHLKDYIESICPS